MYAWKVYEQCDEFAWNDDALKDALYSASFNIICAGVLVEYQFPHATGNLHTLRCGFDSRSAGRTSVQK